MRIVIDTNLWISAFISRKFQQRLFIVIQTPSIYILTNHHLLEEIERTISKSKFEKYISPEKRKELLLMLNSRLDFVNIKSEVKICRDPNDDFLLSHCKDGNADYLITGDKDLLVVNPFENTQILTLTDFEIILQS